VLYLVQEDIEAAPQAQLNAVCAFLGLENVSLPESLQRRYGQGSVPRLRWLAAAASSSASALRRAGLHRTVEAGKRLGLKRVYAGGHREGLAMKRDIFEYLLAEHEADIRFLEGRLGRQFAHWRDPAKCGWTGQ
jgi:hypothetical protein